MGWGTVPGQLPHQLKWAIWVGDVQTGKSLGSYDLPEGSDLPKGGDAFTWAASGAADDRTFVVAANRFRSARPPAPGPAQFYLFKLFPGSADPVRVTRLALQATPATAVATQVTSVALSADGTELAVLSDTGKSVGLGVYSVATGRRQHFWSAVISRGNLDNTPVTDLSWVGDGTVAFAFIQAPHVRQDVRTLDVKASGTGLLAGSRVVWSQAVPSAAGGTDGRGTPRTCDTPFLTGNGQAVVCATSSYSASTKRLSALWLAYPLATPTRPRVIGSVQAPPGTQGFNGPNTVDWANSTGTEVIGSWNPAVSTSVTSNNAFIGGGKIRSFPWLAGFPAAW
jgi:hypothetical protein